MMLNLTDFFSQISHHSMHVPSERSHGKVARDWVHCVIDTHEGVMEQHHEHKWHTLTRMDVWLQRKF